jgi:exonuclease VII small subunit
MTVLFADADGYIAAGILGAVLAGLVAVLKEYLPWRLKKKEMEGKDRRDAYESALDECNKTIGRLEQQGDRFDKALHEQQVFINGLAQQYADCREEGVELRGFIFFLHSTIRRQRNTLIAAGIPAEDVPDLPQFRGHRDEKRQVEFDQKTTAQNTTLVAESHKAIKETLPPKEIKEIKEKESGDSSCSDAQPESFGP